MILEAVCVGSMQVNCYILASGRNSEAVIIDPGDQMHKIKSALCRYNLNPAFIINTHGHIDHIGCDNEFNVPVYIHKDDSALLKDPGLNLSAFFAYPFSVKTEIRLLEDGGNIELGSIQLEVIHVPGHTPGGISLLLKKPKNNILFTGDSLFFHGIGRTDFPGADEGILIEFIKKRLFRLDDCTIIYPGHGMNSTIGEERRNNPFLN